MFSTVNIHCQDRAVGYLVINCTSGYKRLQYISVRIHWEAVPVS
jgi:hypothetical protein